MPPETNRGSRLESIVFYLVLAAAVLAPLAFWPTQYFALESVKTLVIGLLTTVSVVLLTIRAMKTREVRMPPRSMVTIGVLMAVSIFASAISAALVFGFYGEPHFVGSHFMKAMFGQGFELGAGGFILTLLVAGLVGYISVVRRADRVALIYAGIVGAYVLVWLIQVIRLLGASSMTFGILNSVTASLVGNWFSFGIFSAVVGIISVLALSFLRLSAKMKVAYYVTAVMSVLALFIVNSREIWQNLFLVFLGLTIYMTSQKVRPEGGAISAFFKRLSWTPLVICVVAFVLAWQGMNIAGPTVNAIGATYSELSLPWRLTLDVAAGELKANPMLGSGPNRFSTAFLNYKPSAINTTDAWGVEFNAGFGLIPTFLVTQGFFGGIMWVLFFVFFGLLGTRSLKGLVRAGGSGDSISENERPYARFVILSSYLGATLIWLMSLIYVPAHSMMFYGFLMTGIWLGTSVAYGRLRPVDVVRKTGSASYSIVPIIQIVIIIVAVLWAVAYIKNSAALAYFGAGVRNLTVASDPIKADASFQNAIALNPLDIYWQARAEAAISQTNKLLSTVTSNSDASTTNAIVTQAVATANKAIEYSNNAIKADPDNYNNHISQARVAELGTIMKMQSSYENAVNAYANAIRRNPGNPSLYVSLAKLQASQNQLDAAIQTVGAALQVKQNYLDAVFLLSQIEAAKGNLNDAIVAAQFATELNPNNALLLFQLGLLKYNKGDYAGAAVTLDKAASLQHNYANAQYFLGLSYARIGKTQDAIVQFEKLAASNTDNKEVALILSTLKEGKSLFAPQTPAATAVQTAKRSTPPIKESK